MLIKTAFAPSDAMGARQLQEPAPRLRSLLTEELNSYLNNVGFTPERGLESRSRSSHLALMVTGATFLFAQPIYN